MFPSLIPGGNVKIRRLAWKKCRVGDIIIFRLGEQWKLTAHRLLFRVPLIRTGWMYQKGDRNRFGAWVRAKQVIGIVVETDRPDGTSLDFSKPSERKKARRSAYYHLAKDIIWRSLFIPVAVHGKVKNYRKQ
jgi:hypothetical protein